MHQTWTPALYFAGAGVMLGYMPILIRIFVTVLGINIFPVFMPPTWMVLTYFQVRHGLDIFTLAIIGTFAATAGRMILARLSDLIIRKNFLRERTRANIDVIKNRLIEHKKLTIWVFLFYAFSPLPSNQLFIAYGLTELPLTMVAVPFFIGRFLSYLFWVFTASRVTLVVTASAFDKGAFMSVYYVIVQIITLMIVWLFTKINWEKLLKEKKLNLLK